MFTKVNREINEFCISYILTIMFIKFAILVFITLNFSPLILNYIEIWLLNYTVKSSSVLMYFFQFQGVIFQVKIL